jgi:hypothetical protein
MNLGIGIGIILTGIIEYSYLDSLIDCYEGCIYTKIISTWDYTDKGIIEKLEKNNFIVIQNSFPDNLHKCSVNYQNYSMLKGIEYAENIGLTHVLRMRSDMICSNINSLLNIYETIFVENKMIFLLYFRHDTGYLIDYAHFGSIEYTKRYINCFINSDDNRYPEKFRQENCFGTCDFNIIKEHVIFSAELLLSVGIDFRYVKESYKYYPELLKDYVNCGIAHFV